MENQTLNDAQIKRLKKLKAKVAPLIAEAKELEAEVQGAFDEMPKPMQQSKEGQTVEESAESLGAIVEALETAEELLTWAVDPMAGINEEDRKRMDLEFQRLLDEYKGTTVKIGSRVPSKKVKATR